MHHERFLELIRIGDDVRLFLENGVMKNSKVYNYVNDAIYIFKSLKLKDAFGVVFFFLISSLIFPCEGVGSSSVSCCRCCL